MHSAALAHLHLPHCCTVARLFVGCQRHTAAGLGGFKLTHLARKALNTLLLGLWRTDTAKHLLRMWLAQLQSTRRQVRHSLQV